VIGALAELVVKTAAAKRRTPASARGHEMLDARRYESLGELLRDALVQFKTNTALVEASRKREKRRLTYLGFKRAALPIARRLEDAGIGAGDRVAILMSNQSRWLLGAYAAMYRGAILVPLDYKLDAREQAALLTHAQPRALLTEHSLFARLGPDAPEIGTVLVTEAPPRAQLPANVERWEEAEAAVDGAAPTFVHRTRDDVASIVYSSGTGGRPKGCMLTHDNYLEQYRSLSRRFPLVEGHRYFSILPTNHAIDFMVGFVGPLCGGATVVHQRSLRPELVNWTMREYRITHMAVVPLILEAFERRILDELDELPPTQRGLFESLVAFNQTLTERRPSPRVSRTLLKPIHDAFGGSLEMLFCGGAFVDPARAALFHRLGIPVVIGYGLTEASTVATVNDLSPFRADTVGRAVDGVEVRILDPDSEGVGEVLLRGRTLMKGYLDDPGLTTETIRDGWLHTGDLGWLDASDHLHLVGRRKNVVVTAGGKNIYPEDVEHAFEGLPCEEMCVVASNFVWPHDGTRIEDEVLLAVVRADDGDAKDLVARIRERNGRLPDFKRVRGLLRWDREFPRTASMKLKREALARELADALDRSAVEAV
jgi:long-chain acyl-CoA synthetase